MITQILKELKNNAPFTTFGALTGILIMMFTLKLPKDISYNIYYTVHPLHVMLSAIVTAAIYELHECQSISKKCIIAKCNLWKLLLIGYLGLVGIATLSDSVIP